MSILYFCFWLIETFFSIFWLFFWLWVIFLLVVWLKSIGGGYEKLERQFEEENIRCEWAELKAKESAKRLKNK